MITLIRFYNINRVCHNIVTMIGDEKSRLKTILISSYKPKILVLPIKSEECMI